MGLFYTIVYLSVGPINMYLYHTKALIKFFEGKSRFTPVIWNSMVYSTKTWMDCFQTHVQTFTSYFQQYCNWLDKKPPRLWEMPSQPRFDLMTSWKGAGNFIPEPPGLDSFKEHLSGFYTPLHSQVKQLPYYLHWLTLVICLLDWLEIRRWLLPLFNLRQL